MLSNISPKVIWSTVAAVIVTGVLAMLGYLQTDDGVALFAGLPVLLVIGIKASITAAATALTGYVVTDPLRAAGEDASELPEGNAEHEFAEGIDEDTDEVDNELLAEPTTAELVAELVHQGVAAELARRLSPLLAPVDVEDANPQN